MGGVRTKRQPQSEHHSPDHGHGRQLTAVAHPTREAPELSIVGHALVWLQTCKQIANERSTTAPTIPSVDPISQLPHAITQRHYLDTMTPNGTGPRLQARPCQGRGREFESRLPLQLDNWEHGQMAVLFFVPNGA